MTAFWETSFFSMLRDKGHLPADLNDGEACEYRELQWTADNAERVDCRKLNRSFLLDTGIARSEAMAAGEETPPKMPFGACALLQFDGMCCQVSEGGHYGVDDEEMEHGITVLEVCSWAEPYGNGVAIGRPFAECVAAKDWAEFSLMFDDEVPPYEPINVINGRLGEEQETKTGALMVLGLLTLFEERLLLQRTSAKARTAINMKRERDGLPAIVGHKVLTLNLAETRRRTLGVSLHGHESPTLHWRRGHWRTLGRGSEFESRTWIRRCLVGDPDKGFVAKHYRAVWQPTIH